jgi:hypothetical protein
MRSSHAFVLVTMLAACGSDGGTGGDDTMTTPDASDVDPPTRGFQVISKEITIMPGQEITYCYYFRTPNTEAMAINKWKSVMTPGSHHMIMFTTPTEVMPEGTISASNCGFGGGGNASNIPVWTYAAQTANAEVALPGDDGAGMPLAQDIAPNTPAFFQMHYLNPSDTPIQVHVTLNAEALPAGATYTKTAAYITYNNAISIPPGANNLTTTKTCNTPPNTKFWMMSTHAHKQAIKTTVKNGMPASTEIAFESTDWEHPGAKSWAATPFYSFAANQNKLTFECTYNNPTDRTITSGDSAATDEMCMATGYFFPATKPVTCYCAASGCFNF